MRIHTGSFGADEIIITTPAYFTWQPDPGQSGAFHLDYYIGGAEDFTYQGQGSGRLFFHGATLEEGFSRGATEVELYFGPDGGRWGFTYDTQPWHWDPATGTLSAGPQELISTNPYESYWIDGTSIAGSGAGPSPSADPDTWYSFTFRETGHWVAQADSHLVAAGDGDDTVLGGFGALTADGGAGNDVLTARWGDAVLNGGAGNDTLTGGIGRQALDGGRGADTLILGRGNGFANGGAGSDRLVAGDGTQLLAGGGGHDAFVIGGGSGHITIEDFQVGIDRLELESDAVPVIAALGDDTRIEIGGHTVLLLGVTPAEIGGGDWLV